MKKHPIDFEALAKGTIITAEELREIYGEKSESEMGLYRLHLCEQIRCERDDLYPVQRRDTVVLLTDEEAHEHSVATQVKHVRGLVTNAKRRSRIDLGAFGEQKRREVEFWDKASQMQAAAARKQLQKSRREVLLLGSAAEAEGGKI
jgi:hypothetical protein